MKFLRFLWPLFGLSIFFMLSWELKKHFGFSLASKHSVELLRDHLLRLGVFMPLAFVGMYALRGVVYIPESLLMITAGFLVGPIYGVALVWLGMIAAVSLAYGVGKLLTFVGGRALLEKFLEGHLQQAETLTRRIGFRTLIIWRMMPIFPLSLISYSAAIVRMPFRKFLAALAIGVIPPAILYTALGKTMLELYSRSGYVLLGLGLVFAGILYFYYQMLRRLI